MKIKQFVISKNDIILSATAVIEKLDPYHNPDGLDIIIANVNHELNMLLKNKITKTENTSFVFNNYREFEDFLSPIFYNIYEFCQLNLSKKLKDEGTCDANDEKNNEIIKPNIVLDKYNAFIDLDVCIHAIINNCLERSTNFQ